MTHADPIHDDDARIVEIYSAANEVEAGAVHAALEEAGIKARIVGNLLGSATGDLQLGFHTDPKVLVLDVDAAAAREVIARFQAEADRGVEDGSDFGDGLDEPDDAA